MRKVFLRQIASGVHYVGLNHDQSVFEVDSKYMILCLYQELGTNYYQGDYSGLDSSC